MYKILTIKQDSIYLEEIYELLVKYGRLMYTEMENPIIAFAKTLSKKNNVTMVGLKNEKLIAFCTLYNIKKLSNNHFCCYVSGCAKPKQAKNLNALLQLLFKTLKENGCKIIRMETREYNLPMRHLARRLNFRKVGYLECSHFKNGIFSNNILYEKKL